MLPFSELVQSLPLPEAGPKPFGVEVRQRPAKNRAFVPEPVLTVRPSLRTGGLLAALSPEQARDLLWLLTFVSPNGDIVPTLLELKDAMQVSAGKARTRMERLAAFRWKGDAIVSEVRRDSGLHAFAPTPAILETVNVAPDEEIEARSDGASARREAVVAHSRAAYARPKADVEREIAKLNGWPDPADEGETRRARDRLLLFGVPREKAEPLIAEYGAAKALQQADWLPYRRAKKPAQLLVAAIENDYGVPAALRFGNKEAPAE